MLIIANSIPVGFCQDDRWTINENNEGILVYTWIRRRNNKQNTTLCSKKTVTETEIDNQDCCFPEVKVLEMCEITSAWMQTCWEMFSSWALPHETDGKWWKHLSHTFSIRY